MPLEFGELRRDLKRVLDETKEAHRLGVAKLLGDAYGDLIELSDPHVQTGAYRASHTIGTGDPPREQGPETVLWEASEKPEPEGPFAPKANPAARPDVQAARSAATKIQFGQSGIIQNRVRHAEFVEDGTSRMDPQLIYEQAITGMGARVDTVAADIERKIREVAEQG